MNSIPDGAPDKGSDSVSFSAILVLLLFFSLYKPPLDWPGVSIFMVVLTMALLLVALVWKIVQGPGFKDIWQQYKVEGILCFAYVSVCLLSVLVNRARYADLGELIFFGISPIAIWCTFPMALLLFGLQSPAMSKTPRRMPNDWPAWLALVLLCIIGIWQVYDFFAIKPLILHFVSVDVSDTGYVITSLFRTSTDFGPVMGYSAICCVSIAIFCKGLGKVTIGVLLIATLMFMTGGILSSSKNFIMMMLTAGIVLWLPFAKKKPKQALLSVVLLFIATHVVILNSGLATARIGQTLPYIQKIADDQPISAGDFLPSITSGSVLERKRLWSEALTLWLQNPVLGVSAGGFKLSNSDKKRLHATHNVFIQTLTEAGVVGAVIFLLLIGRVAMKRVSNPQIALVAALVVNLQFDYYLDHSLPWILTVSWLLARCGRIETSSHSV